MTNSKGFKKLFSNVKKYSYDKVPKTLVKLFSSNYLVYLTLKSTERSFLVKTRYFVSPFIF